MTKSIWDVLYIGFCMMVGMLFVLFADRKRCVRPVSLGGLACVGYLVAAIGVICHGLYKAGVGHNGDGVFVSMAVLGVLAGTLIRDRQPQEPRD